MNSGCQSVFSIEIDAQGHTVVQWLVVRDNLLIAIWRLLPMAQRFEHLALKGL